jgi:hypothetical protein
MKWFGKNWGAPICSGIEHAGTPVGMECAHGCGCAIRADDRGLLIPSGAMLGATGFDPRQNGTQYKVIDGVPHIAYHLVCFLTSIGSPPPGDLYDVARDCCHEQGMDWTDPRTGKTYPPPKKSSS